MTPAPLLNADGVEIHRVEELTIPMFGPGELFPGFDPARHRLEALPDGHYDVATNMLVMASCAYVIKADGATILVDTGVGNDKPRVREMYARLSTDWLDRLARVVAPGDVDIVVSTHLHVDHVGWNTRLVRGTWEPTFPKARYLFNEVERTFVSGPAMAAIVERNGDYVGDSINPVFEAGLAEVVPLPYRITDSVNLEPGPGDTPGHLLVRVRAGDRTLALVTGDAFHHLLQVGDPGLTSRFSALDAESVATRERIFEESARDGVYLLAGHLASGAPMRLERDGPAYRPRL